MRFYQRSWRFCQKSKSLFSRKTRRILTEQPYGTEWRSNKACLHNHQQWCSATNTLLMVVFERDQQLHYGICHHWGHRRSRNYQPPLYSSYFYKIVVALQSPLHLNHQLRNILLLIRWPLYWSDFVSLHCTILSVYKKWGKQKKEGKDQKRSPISSVTPIVRKSVVSVDESYSLYQTTRLKTSYSSHKHFTLPRVMTLNTSSCWAPHSLRTLKSSLSLPTCDSRSCDI